VKNCNHRKIGGFTFLELMVTLVIGAILMTVGVPAFQSVVAGQRSTASSNDLIESLILARSEAIKRGRYVSVCKSVDGASCAGGGSRWSDGWIIFVNQSAASPATVDAGDEILRVHQVLPGPLTINTSGNIDTFVSFRPVGTAGTNVINYQGTLTLCDTQGNTAPRGLIVFPSGHMQISRDVDHANQPLVCVQG